MVATATAGSSTTEPTTAHDDGPSPLNAPEQSAAAACLQASLLLRRRIHRYLDGGVDDEQTLLAVCHLLDALSRGFAETPTAVPGAVERAAARLADQLNRAGSGGAARQVTTAAGHRGAR